MLFFIECLIYRDDFVLMFFGIIVFIFDESNFCFWWIFFNFYLFKESKNFYNDFKEFKKLCNFVEDIIVEFEVKFYFIFFFDLLFVCVLFFRFKMYLGYVIIGGSICMEFFMVSGWSFVCNFESLFV